MERLFHLVLGLVLGVLFILYARTTGPRREPLVYAIGLVVAALLYVVFSLNEAGIRWLVIEGLGVMVFALIAVLGLRVAYWFLAIGWALHIFWDVFLHLVRQQEFVPDWYPTACISFDLIVAGAIAAKLRRQKW